MSFFQIVRLLIFLYVALRFVLPLPLRAIWKTLLIALLLPISQHLLIYDLVYGTIFSPELPRPLLLAITWSHNVFVFLFVFTVLADLIFGVTAAFRRRVLPPRGKHLVRYAVALLAVSLASFGFWQAIKVPDVRRVELAIGDLPRGLEGFRFVQLTDLHICRFFEAPWVSAVVARTNALDPDLIVITGDIIDGTPEARRADVAPLRDLRAKHGVIASPGNHEYYFDFPRWRAVFEELGFLVLANQHSVLRINGQSLVVAGVTDPVADRYGLAAPDIVAALNGGPTDVPILLLSHRPAGAKTHAAAGVDIQLSGHTHGGMMKLFDRLVANANEGFVAGHYTIGDMQLYVSRGTGLWNGFALRLGVPSEITEFTLRRANN